jgi:ribonuclease inhibitor
MTQINLNFETIRTKEQLHAMLKTELNLPAYYGANLDALWDCLGGCIGVPVRINIRGVARLREQLGDYADQLAHVFRKAGKEMNGIEVTVHQ